MPRPEEIVVAPLFAGERHVLLDLLRSLREEDWGKPTPCEAWDVHGICLHLVGDDLSTLSRRRDDYHGTPMPDGLDPREKADWLDGVQQEWVHAARRISPQLAIEILAMTGPRLEAQFAAEDPKSVTAHVSWASDEAVPVGLDHLRELSEYWVHRQQILDALRRPRDPEPLLPTVLDGLRWAFPHGMRHLSAGVGDAVEIEVGGDATAAWCLVFDGTGWAFTDELPARVIGTLRLSASQAWRLLTNNLPASQRYEIDAVGEPAVTDALLSSRAIIGRARWSSWPQ